MASTLALPKLPLFEAITSHDAGSTAVIHSLSGRRFTYGDLVKDVAEGKQKLSHHAEGKPLEGERIAFLVENGYDYVGARACHLRKCCRCREADERGSDAFIRAW